MEETLRRATPHVGTYLGRLRWAALGVLALRASVVGLGALVAAFTVAALAVGPTASGGVAGVAWASIAALAVGAAAGSLRAARGVRGGSVARLLAPRDPWLASAAQTAYELGAGDAPTATSEELARAHEESVRRALLAVPLRAAVPWAWLRHGSVALAAVAAAASLLGLAGLDRAATGTYALLHPDARAEDGARFADVAARTRGELVFPAHLQRPPRSLEPADLVEAPAGTTVRYTLETRVSAVEARAIVDGREILLEARGARRFAGRFVVRADAPLALRVLDAEGRWLTDARTRSVRVLPDRAPEVLLGASDASEVVGIDQAVRLPYDARDDVGLAEVVRVLRGADGREHRLPLAELDGGSLTPRHEGITTFSPRDIDARPGDRIAVYVEARDGDVVSGPHVGRSEERTFVVESDATRRDRAVASLEGLLGLGLGALADRLESPVPEASAEATARRELVGASTGRFAASLEAGMDPDAGGEDLAGRDRAALRELGGRLRRLDAREGTLHGRPSPLAARREADAKLVEALEEAVLELDGRIARARIEDASELARELDALRREMTSLLAELRRTDSPEAREALLAALSRAQQRMRELAERVAALGADVPHEFLNADSLEEATSPDALASLREAVERGDLAGAERHLLDLQAQIDGMARMLGSAETAFAEARFGPRDRAFAEALDSLAGLEAEQRELSRRSDDVRRAAAARALESASPVAGSVAEGALQETRRARDRLRQVPRASLGTMDEETLDTTSQRTVDVEDALRGGDLGEARRMAEAALAEADALARDLELNALMFPGRRGEMAEAARQARAAADSLRGLEDAIDRAMPRMADFVAPPDRARMSADATRQGRVIAGTEALARALGEGGDGPPLSSDAAQALHDAEGDMQRADRALRDGDPIEAARAQEEASRRLAEVRESLERDASPSPSGGGAGGGGGQDALRDPSQRVEIPRAGAAAGPIDRRRRVLDAMGDTAPRGYEEAARRYYEELLR